VETGEGYISNYVYITISTTDGLGASAEGTANYFNAGVSYVAMVVGGALGVDEAGGKLVIWTVASVLIAGLITCFPLLINKSNGSPLGWQIGVIAFVAMFIVGGFIAFVDPLIVIFIAVMSAIIIAKFGADIFTGGG